jgi:CheY-like chemotaxis protein
LARKILLADDSVTAQNMGRRILTDAGYEVVTVNNGSAAMKKVAEIKPDLIVLDVYMPGYGGLEICQRVRETPELSRIPILLTVGKLEPFKADDAKRVRADAFVIKPFDASELLAALTKLEDKIVPTKANLTGRFARAVASIEEAKSGKEFGDTDSGWKSRLKIPAPYSKPHNAHADEQGSQNSPEPAAEVPAAKRENAPTLKETFLEKAAEAEKATKATGVPAKVDQPEKEKVASILPPEVASALPSDVTPEEIEAITAAAAMLAQHADAVAESEEAAQAEDFSPESVLRKLAEGPEGATFASNGETSDSAPASKDASKEQASVPATTNKNGEEDVVAALASLAPSSSKAEIADPSEPAAVTVAAPVIEYSGPRWVAVEVSMAIDDSTSVLDQEMELSYAAFAAADAARMAVVDDRPKSFAHEEKAEVSAPETPVVEKASEAEIAPVQVEALAQEEGAGVASESVAPAAEQGEAAPQAAAEIAPETSTSQQASSETVAEPPQAEQHEQGAQPEEKAAYAVAAAGGSSVGVSEAPVANTVPTVNDPEVQRQNDLAAAWANWKQVREGSNGQAENPTISNESAAQEMSQTETSSSGFRDFRSEPAATVEQTDVEEESSDETADAPEDAAEVANIVDSVLADLKPKLMKEIAQKMGKGKKKKKKS